MNEDDENNSTTIADIAGRLIENEVYKQNYAKLALILGGILDVLLPDEDDNQYTVPEMKIDLLQQIMHELLYHEAVFIEEEVQNFRDWIDGATEVPTENEEEN